MALVPKLCSTCGDFPGTRWCIGCNEGICITCEKLHGIINMSGDHKVIGISDFREMKKFFVSESCEDHNEPLTQFCRTHNKALCEDCVEYVHSRCYGDIVPLSQVAKKAKDLMALDGLEEKVTQSLSHVEFLLNAQTVASDDLEKHVRNIKESIDNLRSMINKHLDRLQEDLIEELNNKFDECKKKSDAELADLKTIEIDLSSLKKQLDQMKKFGSDVQLFLGRNQVSKLINDRLSAVEIVLSTTAKNHVLDLKLHPMTNSLFKDMRYFGQIITTEKIIDLPKEKEEACDFSSDCNGRVQIHYQFTDGERKGKKPKLKSILKKKYKPL